MTQADRIKDVFTRLRADNLEILDGFYDENVNFVDPLGEHKGRKAIKAYYKNLYENVTSIEFVYDDIITSGSKHVLVWKMKLKAKGLNGGELVEVDGNSVIEFNEHNLVIYHRDYFDMGEFIYENVPVLSWIISKVKSRLKE